MCPEGQRSHSLSRVLHSRNVWIACCVFILGTGVFYYPKWKLERSEATISWDVSGYYYYLPAIFIYKDVRQVAFHRQIHEKYYPGPPYQTFTHPSGNQVFKYSCGLALQYLPAFAAAHLYANLTSWEADGFSRPYQLAISLEALLVACLGLWLLRNVLLHYWKDKIVSIVLVTLVFATNYLDYSAINGAMAHNYLFALYALLLFYTIRFYRTPDMHKSVVLGVVLGVMILTRPSEILALVIPLLWNVHNADTLKTRIRFLRQNAKYVVTAGLALALVGSLQLIYWKYASGEWVVYSYEDQGFSWMSPHFVNGLFSYRAGWLVYTPVMILVFPGFVVLYRKNRDLFWTTAVFSLIFMYVTWSWDIWWYGGSLGQRAMVQAYPVLAFPLAAMTAYLWRRRTYVRSIFVGVLIVCIYYNLWMTHQAHRGGLFRAGEMTKAYFWKILGRYDVPEESDFLLDNAEQYFGPQEEVIELYTEDFESEDAGTCPLEPVEGSASLCLLTPWDQSRIMTVPFDKSRAYVRATAVFRAQKKEWDIWKMPVFYVRLMQGESVVKERHVRVFRVLESGKTRRLWVDLEVPDNGSFNRVAAVIMNGGSAVPIAVDNLRIEAFNPG